MLLHERLQRAPAGRQREDPRDRRPQGVARGRQRRPLLRGAGRRHQRRSGCERFFTLKPNGYQISQTLRESIVFAPHNLIRDAPFTKLDLITCRNLLIYFQPHAQKTVLTLFHFSLKPGGFLFLGSSESPGGLLDEFDTIDEHAQDLPQAARHRAAARPEAAAAAQRHRRRVRAGARCRAAPASSRSCWRIYDRLLDRFMPPSFLVDEHGQLVDTFGGVEIAAEGQGAAPVAEPARHAGRRSADGRLRRAAPRPPGRRERPLSRRCRCPATAGRFSLVAEPLRDPHGALTHVLISLADSDAASAAVAGSAVRRRARRGARPPSRTTLVRRSTACRAISMRALEDELVLHQGEPAGGDPGARDHQRGAAGDQRGADRRRTRSCRARTRSCTRSTRSCTPSTPSTRRRTSSCRS